MKRDIDTNSEAWRFQCERNYVCNKYRRSQGSAYEYLELVKKRRGEEAAKKLEQGFLRQLRGV